MNYFQDAASLIEHSKTELNKIKKAYSDSLNEKIIKTNLLIDIKNFMENLRSALDFTAYGLWRKYGNTAIKKPKIYFPYAWTDLDLAEFRKKQIIEKKIPALTANRPDIVSKLEGYQYFNSPANSWLAIFMDLNNEN
jgi:hypothetical protein